MVKWSGAKWCGGGGGVVWCGGVWDGMRWDGMGREGTGVGLDGVGWGTVGYGGIGWDVVTEQRAGAAARTWQAQSSRNHSIKKPNTANAGADHDPPTTPHAPLRRRTHHLFWHAPVISRDQDGI